MKQDNFKIISGHHSQLDNSNLGNSVIFLSHLSANVTMVKCSFLHRARKIHLKHNKHTYNITSKGLSENLQESIVRMQPRI